MFETIRPSSLLTFTCQQKTVVFMRRWSKRPATLNLVAGSRYTDPFLLVPNSQGPDLPLCTQELLSYAWLHFQVLRTRKKKNKSPRGQQPAHPQDKRTHKKVRARAQSVDRSKLKKSSPLVVWVMSVEATWRHGSLQTPWVLFGDFPLVATVLEPGPWTACDWMLCPDISAVAVKTLIYFNEKISSQILFLELHAKSISQPQKALRFSSGVMKPFPRALLRRFSGLGGQHLDHESWKPWDQLQRLF